MIDFVVIVLTVICLALGLAMAVLIISEATKK